MNIKIVLLLLFLPLTSSVFASDLQREKRLANEIVDSILDGEPVYLQAGKHKFLSIYMESESKNPKGTVILLHGRGYHPNWKDVIHPLRIGLPDSGWHTLSIQMPVLTKDAKYYDYVPLFKESFPRIESAIKFIKSKNINNIILIAHSCGAHMGMAWLDKTRGKDINAYIGIGMGATDLKQYMAKPFSLDKLKIPILDIYAKNDYRAVIKMAPERLSMIKSTGIMKSKQVVIPDANHYFTDRDEALLNTISSWLNTLNN
ncbi:MAG: DUF3530 family protein [Woeseiaceae bacterium]